MFFNGYWTPNSEHWTVILSQLIELVDMLALKTVLFYVLNKVVWRPFCPPPSFRYAPELAIIDNQFCGLLEISTSESF